MKKTYLIFAVLFSLSAKGGVGDDCPQFMGQYLKTHGISESMEKMKSVSSAAVIKDRYSFSQKNLVIDSIDKPDSHSWGMWKLNRNGIETRKVSFKHDKVSQMTTIDSIIKDGRKFRTVKITLTKDCKVAEMSYNENVDPKVEAYKITSVNACTRVWSGSFDKAKEELGQLCKGIKDNKWLPESTGSETRFTTSIQKPEPKPEKKTPPKAPAKTRPITPKPGATGANPQ